MGELQPCKFLTRRLTKKKLANTKGNLKNQKANEIKASTCIGLKKNTMIVKSIS